MKARARTWPRTARQRRGIMHGCLCLPGNDGALADAERAIFETTTGESARDHRQPTGKRTNSESGLANEPGGCERLRQREHCGKGKRGRKRQRQERKGEGERAGERVIEWASKCTSD